MMRAAMQPAPETLARAISEFVAGARQAVVLEDGELLFDFATARYSLSTEHGKCVLHVWSPERNAVRRVLDAGLKAGVLKLSVLRFGQSKPSRMEICPGDDRRTATAKRSARTGYQQLLGGVRHFPGFTAGRLSSAMDLGHSFGPIFSRGIMRKGGSASSASMTRKPRRR